MLGLSRKIDWVNDQFAVIADWFVLGACVISAGNASIRYLFNYSSNAWLEIQWYMFGAVVLLGASNTLRKNEHVRVDIVYASVTDRTRLWIDIIGFTIFLLPTGIFLTILSIPFFLQSLAYREVSMNAGGLILWPIKLVLPLGFGLLTLQGVSELIKRVAALRGAIEIDTHYEKPLQ